MPPPAELASFSGRDDTFSLSTCRCSKTVVSQIEPTSPTLSFETVVTVRFHLPPGVCSTWMRSPMLVTLTSELSTLRSTVVSVTPRSVFCLILCAPVTASSVVSVLETSHVPSSVARACTW